MYICIYNIDSYTSTFHLFVLNTDLDSVVFGDWSTVFVLEQILRCQYLYFCTIKSSKVSTTIFEHSSWGISVFRWWSCVFASSTSTRLLLIRYVRFIFLHFFRYSTSLSWLDGTFSRFLSLTIIDNSVSGKTWNRPNITHMKLFTPRRMNEETGEFHSGNTLVTWTGRQNFKIL